MVDGLRWQLAFARVGRRGAAPCSHLLRSGGGARLVEQLAVAEHIRVVEESALLGHLGSGSGSRSRGGGERASQTPAYLSPRRVSQGVAARAGARADRISGARLLEQRLHGCHWWERRGSFACNQESGAHLLEQRLHGRLHHAHALAQKVVLGREVLQPDRMRLRARREPPAAAAGRLVRGAEPRKQPVRQQRRLLLRVARERWRRGQDRRWRRVPPVRVEAVLRVAVRVPVRVRIRVPPVRLDAVAWPWARRVRGGVVESLRARRGGRQLVCWSRR